MDELRRLKAQVTALSIVTERAWAHLFTNFTPDPLATCQKAAEQSLSSHDDLLAQLRNEVGPLGDGGVEFMQTVLHFEEEFWSTVQKRIQQITAARQSPPY